MLVRPDRIDGGVQGAGAGGQRTADHAAALLLSTGAIARRIGGMSTASWRSTFREARGSRLTFHCHRRSTNCRSRTWQRSRSTTARPRRSTTPFRSRRSKVETGASGFISLRRHWPLAANMRSTPSRARACPPCTRRAQVHDASAVVGRSVLAQRATGRAGAFPLRRVDAETTAMFWRRRRGWSASTFAANLRHDRLDDVITDSTIADTSFSSPFRRRTHVAVALRAKIADRAGSSARPARAARPG